MRPASTAERVVEPDRGLQHVSVPLREVWADLRLDPDVRLERAWRETEAQRGETRRRAA